MGLIISTTDFTGKNTIAKNNYTILETYIDRYEKKYLRDLLGATLAQSFIDDYSNPTQADIYAAITDEFYLDDDMIIRSSRGLKEMLLGFVYFEFMCEQKVKPTITGLVIGQAENSNGVGGDTQYIYARYNEAIDTYNAIQWYISEHDTDYDDYNGQCKSIAHWSI